MIDPQSPVLGILCPHQQYVTIGLISNWNCSLTHTVVKAAIVVTLIFDHLGNYSMVPWFHASFTLSRDDLFSCVRSTQANRWFQFLP